MKTLSQILFLSILSLIAVVGCKKKSDGGSSSPEVIACTPNQAYTNGQYCNNGALVTAQPCTPGTIAPQGYICTNGYLYPINMPGGMGGMSSLLNNVQFTNQEMQAVVNFGGQGTTDVNGMISPANYSGPVVMNGMLVTTQQLCGAPAGTYSISGQGMMSMGVVSNMTATIQGPAQMQLNIGSAYFTNSFTRLGIFYSTLTVNGVPCGSITSY